MKLTSEIVQQILDAVLATKDEEISCSQCYEQVEKFAELKLHGRSPEEAMPLVEGHLQLCKECREEYEVLLASLQHIEKFV